MDFDQKKHEAELDNMNVMNKEIVDAAAKKIAERDTERRTNEAAKTLQINDYRQKRETLKLRFKRAEEDAQKKYLNALSEANAKFTNGDADTTVHEKEMKKAREEKDKAIREAQIVQNEKMEELRQANPTGYDYCRWED